jgi:dTDP-4-dehydrorhamnose reductase
MARIRPWAVINASGYLRVDEAELDALRCFREIVDGAAVLATACAAHQVQLLTFSSDVVFDGRKAAPYIESDATGPLNTYERSKAEAERAVLACHPAALVVRTSSFFGPWDRFNFVTKSLAALQEGQALYAPNDITVSPTYVPDLVNTCLDLLVDGEGGVWHLTNGEPVTWADFALKAAQLARVDASRLEPVSFAHCGLVAARPAYSALHIKRAVLLPTLDSALLRFLEQCDSLEHLHGNKLGKQPGWRG